MGLFDSLFGTGTAQATNAATTNANAAIGNQIAANDGILQNSYGNANAALNTGATNATGAINQGYGSGVGALTSYGGQAQSQLASGVGNAVGTVQGSNAAYQPYQASGGVANAMLANSEGLNGAAGNAAATAAFQAGPGYQWQVDQATDAAARKAASLGMAGSGNTLSAITQLGSNLANQEYGNWQSGLSGLGTQGLTANNAVSGNNVAAGGYQYGGGTTGAALSQQLGGGIGTLDAAQGNQLGTVQSNLGTSLANEQTGYGNALVNNGWTGLNAINGNSLADAKAQDAATSTNNGIFSKLLMGTPASGDKGSSGIFGTLLSGLKL